MSIDDKDFEYEDLDPFESGATDRDSSLLRELERTNEILSSRIAPVLERIAAALEVRVGARADTEAPVHSVATLRARLEASRSANDPESVMVLRDELASQLEAESLAELDQDVVRWLLRLIQRRMRSGTVRADVVHLAGRVADRFGATLEGASLRASLPTLRRSAGLCPVCAEPYTGLEDACPTCLSTRRGVATPTAEGAAEAAGQESRKDKTDPEPGSD